MTATAFEEVGTSPPNVIHSEDREAQAVALANFITEYSTLAHLTFEQREHIGQVIAAVELNSPETTLSTGCFQTSQSIAIWDYEHGDGRIRYVEGCLKTTDTEPAYGTDVTRAGRYHHGYNSIDGVIFDIVLPFHDPAMGERLNFAPWRRGNSSLESILLDSHERGIEVPSDDLTPDGYPYYGDEFAYEVFGTDEDDEVAVAAAESEVAVVLHDSPRIHTN